MPETRHTQVKVSVDPRVAADFKRACLASGVSMASVLSAYMARFGRSPGTGSPPDPLSTKRQRRAAVEKVVAQLRLILDAERAYMDRIPENLQSSLFFDSAESWLSSIEDAIDALSSLP